MNFPTRRLICPLAVLLLAAGPAAAQNPVPPPEPNTEPTVITKPQRTLEAIEKTYEAMQPVKYDPPVDRWAHLPRTRKILKEGGELRVVMLGDSIMNDLSRSGWELLLRRHYPNVTVHKVTVVRGSTGAWWYKEGDRVRKYVLEHKPDLVILGGISHRNDTDSIHEVVKQVRAGSGADVLLLTPPFGRFDPLDEEQWKRTILDPPAGDYRPKLTGLASELKAELLDMQKAWGEYVRASGKPVEGFRRDAIHANEAGEQVIGRILVAYLAPKPPERPVTKPE